MNRNEYNGWTNYETWNWKLWADNDQRTYDFYREAALDICKANPDKNKAVYSLAAYLKDVAEEDAPTLIGVYADLLGAALSEIDWHEIATSYVEDLEYYKA